MIYANGESIFAPAKINLYLHVLGKREDGYHRLESLVTFSNVGDTVTVLPGGTGHLQISGPFAAELAHEPPESNLILRAARQLAALMEKPLTVDFHLEKRLPVASGIGGGSADAAAALRGLARHWGLAPADPRLQQIAFRCGADVPVCLAGRPMQILEAGEVLREPPPLPSCSAVLLNPGFPLATPAVFRARQGPFFAPLPPLTAAPDGPEGLITALAERRNDLMPPALRLAPVIGDGLAALMAQPGCRLARLSGSGATVFGLFVDPAAAQAAAGVLQQAFPGWWCVPCVLNGSEPEMPGGYER